MQLMVFITAAAFGGAMVAWGSIPFAVPDHRIEMIFLGFICALIALIAFLHIKVDELLNEIRNQKQLSEINSDKTTVESTN